MQKIAYQPELSPALPVVYGNVDYQAFRALLIRINELLERSGVEAKCLRACRQQAQAADTAVFSLGGRRRATSAMKRRAI